MQANRNIFLAITLLVVATLACQVLNPATTPAQSIEATEAPSETAAEIEILPPTATTEPEATATSAAEPTETPLPEATAAEAAADEPAPSPTTEPEELAEPEEPAELDTEPFDIPVLSGAEQIIATEHFRVHYTLEGDDAVETPAYAQTVADTMEQVWAVQVDQLGWAAPPSDRGLGGDERYDVYLLNIFETDGTAGYTDGGFEETFVGDNPATAAIEARAHFSYLVLDNDYSDLHEYEVEYSVFDYMRSTAAHEFHHAIQFGYDGEEPLEWLWEATSTWIQTQTFPELRDADEELVAVFKSPDSCQLAYGGEDRVEDENHWYGLWIYLEYLAERYTPDLIRQIWEQARALDGYEALEVALFDAGTTLDESFRGFSLALLLRSFERGSEYPTVRLEGEVFLNEPYQPNDGVGQMGADYVEVIASGPVTISLEGEQLNGVAVGLRGSTAAIFWLTDGQTTVDASQYNHLYLIVLNENRAETEWDCEMRPYTLRVAPANQAIALPTAQSAALNFAPPRVEPLLDPQEYYGETWTEPVELPTEWLPAYVPTEYEFYDAYQMDKSEIQEYADWYIPGDGPALVVDYYGPGLEDYFDITISDNIFSNLAEYYDFIAYEPFPEEEITIRGIPMLSQDYSDTESDYTELFFILGDQFVSLTGTIPMEEMQKVVESLLP